MQQITFFFAKLQKKHAKQHIFEPFYIALPICAWIMHLTFSRVLDCPWTRFENYYRRKCGKPEIKTFIGHYIVKPMRKKW